MSVKYIIPPRLRGRYSLMGFYPEELLVIMVSFFAGLFQTLYLSGNLFLALSALFAVLFFRPAQGKNVIGYLRMLYRYYMRPQVFSLRESDTVAN